MVQQSMIIMNLEVEEGSAMGKWIMEGKGTLKHAAGSKWPRQLFVQLPSS